MFTILLSLFGILGPLVVISEPISLDINNLVWVKTCIGLQYRRALPSPFAMAKKIVNTIKSLRSWGNNDKEENFKEYLKQGNPDFYVAVDNNELREKKCHGLLLNTPLPESLFQKLRSTRSVLPPGLIVSDEISDEGTTKPPLEVDADEEGKYIDTVTNFVRDFLRDNVERRSRTIKNILEK